MSDSFTNHRKWQHRCAAVLRICRDARPPEISGLRNGRTSTQGLSGCHELAILNKNHVQHASVK